MSFMRRLITKLNQPTPRRVRRMRVDLDTLLMLLQELHKHPHTTLSATRDVPHDAKVIGFAHVENSVATIDVFIESESFEPVSLGSSIPELQPMLTTHYNYDQEEERLG